MQVKITSKRQVTFPKRVLDELGVGPGDRLELVASAQGFLLHPRRIDHSLLGTLGDKISNTHPPFDIRAFRDRREQGHGPSVRD